MRGFQTTHVCSASDENEEAKAAASRVIIKRLTVLAC